MPIPEPFVDPYGEYVVSENWLPELELRLVVLRRLLAPAAAAVAGVPVHRSGSARECSECGEERPVCATCGACAGCCYCEPAASPDDFDADELGLDPEQPYDYPEE